MEISPTFNAAAAEGPAAGGAVESSTEAVQPTAQTEGLTTAHGNVEQDSAPQAPDVEVVHSETQALNDAQDRRFEVQARLSDERMRERLKLEAELSRYDDNILQLRGEIGDLENVLNKSGPVRLAWLKLTRQVSRDPKRDLNTLQSTLGMYEGWKTENMQMLEARSVRENEASKPGAQIQPNASAGSQDGKPMSKEQAIARIKFLEENRPAPVHEAHLRPGGKVEQFSHRSAAMELEREISTLKEEFGPAL